jgi:uncharacterized coiled-coil DUF342 family protein
MKQVNFIIRKENVIEKKIKNSLLSAAVMLLFAFLLPLAAIGQQPTGTYDLGIRDWTSGGSQNCSWGVDYLVVGDGADIIVTGTVSDGRRIDVPAGATVRITLQNCNIDASTSFNNAITIGYLGAANVTLTLDSNNTLQGGPEGAAIYVGQTSTLTIEGAGTLTANGGANGGAGIGGNYGGGTVGTITINGGRIIATGGDGSAGIGGGHGDNGGDGGTVMITGGTITAIGGTLGGAGIGGGVGDNGGNGGTVTITGGMVMAEGGPGPGLGIGISGGVGIGGGQGGIGGGQGSVGVGGSQGGNGGTVMITGGIVYATGRDIACGIGGGSGVTSFGNGVNGGDGGTVTITGGRVIVSGNSSAGDIATGGRASGILGSTGRNGAPGTFNLNGHAIVSAVNGIVAPGDRTGGILYLGINGTVHGTVDVYDYAVTENCTLTVPVNSMLINSSKLSFENNAKIDNFGIVLNGDIIYRSGSNWNGYEPVETPENPKIEYDGCMGVKTYWDVVSPVDTNKNVGVTIEINGAFTEIYHAHYSEGLVGVNIRVPDSLLYGDSIARTLTAKISLDRFPAKTNTSPPFVQNMAWQQFTQITPGRASNGNLSLAWETNNGIYCIDWIYRLHIKQGDNDTLIEYPVSTKNVIVNLGDNFSPYDSLQIELSAYDGKSPRELMSSIETSFVLTDVILGYRIGEIPKQSVWHDSEKNLKFVVLDALGADTTVGFAVSSPLQGETVFYDELGLFVYYIHSGDVSDFTVTFTAYDSLGNQTKEQTVPFTIVASSALPELTVLGALPKNWNPNYNDYIVRSTSSGTPKMFNNYDRIVRHISVSGKVLDFSNSEKLTGLNNRKDIENLDIYAETVIIGSPLLFPQTNVTIYARELVFDANGSINTSPDTLTSTASDEAGKNGMNAGNITLYIHSLTQNSASQIRFISIGGPGESVISNDPTHTPGNGGNGGTLTSTINISSISQLELGKAGVKTDGSAMKAVGRHGNPARFVIYSGDEFVWMHQNWLSAVLKYGRDAYLSQNNAYTQQIFEEYTSLIKQIDFDALLENGNAADTVRYMELANVEMEMQVLLSRLGQNLDFFGNPIGWVPMLSFEVQKQMFEKEIERAIRVMYLNYWLSHIDTNNAQGITAYKEAVNQINAELSDLAAEIAAMAEEITRIENNTELLLVKIEDIVKRIEAKRDELLKQAEKDVERQKKFELVSNILSGIANVAPVLNKVIPGLGSGIAVVASVGNSALTMAASGDFSAGGFINAANHFAQNGGLNHLTEFMKSDSVRLREANAAKNNAVDYSKKIGPMIEKAQTMYTSMMTAATEDEKIQATLDKLMAESPQYKELIKELDTLNMEKLEYINNLVLFLDKFAAANMEVQKGITAIDGLYEGIDGLSSVRDARAMQHLDEMDRRARQRLLEYHYYLAKSYEYRLLRPYTAPLDMTNIWNNFKTIAESGSNSPKLNSEQFQDIKPIYESLLSDISHKILTDFNDGNRKEQSITTSVTLTQAEVDALNKGKEITLNLLERTDIPLSEENVRITGFRVRENNDIKANGTGSFNLHIKHAGTTMLRSQGEMYWFDHRSKNITNPFIWSIKHDVDRKETESHEPSKAESSLLYSLLEGDASKEIMIYSRPGTLAEVHISKENRAGANALESVTFELKYDYVRRDENAPNLNVYTKEVTGRNNRLTPFIQISEEDKGGRSNGRSPIYRTYTSNTNITLTAPQQYGMYRFVNWTDCIGNELLTALTISSKMAKDLDVCLIANYIYIGPILQVIDTIYVSESTGSIDVKNVGEEKNMYWCAVSDTASWLNIESGNEGVDDGKIQLSFDANTTNTPRVSYIIVTSDDADETKTVVVIQNQSVGINEKSPLSSQMEKINVYPNPTNGQIRIVFENTSDSKNRNIEIYDMLGKRVLLLSPATSPEIDIDISHLPAEIYFLKIQTDKGVITKKIIKE